MRKVLYLISVMVFLFFSTFSRCFAWDIGLLVNDKNLDLKVQQLMFSYSGTPVYVGSELLYNKKGETGKTSWLFTPYFLVTDFYKKPVDFGLGFTGVFGDVHVSDTSKAGIISFGFLFEGKVDLERFSKQVPLMFKIRVNYCPEILNFDQSKRMFDVDNILAWELNSSAAVLVDYKVTKIDTTSSRSWKNYILMIGARVSF